MENNPNLDIKPGWSEHVSWVEFCNKILAQLFQTPEYIVCLLFFNLFNIGFSYII